MLPAHRAEGVLQRAELLPEAVGAGPELVDLAPQLAEPSQLLPHLKRQVDRVPQLGDLRLHAIDIACGVGELLLDPALRLVRPLRLQLHRRDARRHPIEGAHPAPDLVDLRLEGGEPLSRRGERRRHGLELPLRRLRSAEQRLERGPLRLELREDGLQLLRVRLPVRTGSPESLHERGHGTGSPHVMHRVQGRGHRATRGAMDRRWPPSRKTSAPGGRLATCCWAVEWARRRGRGRFTV
jgi:hypothetical protein